MKRTTELVLKFVPFTVKVNAAPPAILLVGKMLVTVGIGLFTVSVRDVVVPPVGVGLKTVIAGVPAAATSAAVSCAVSWVALTRVVTRSFPLKRTIELPLKFVPVAVSTKSASPAVLVVGLILVRVGIGLLIVRLIAVDEPPPGATLKTVIGAKAPTS